MMDDDDGGGGPITTTTTTTTTIPSSHSSGVAAFEIYVSKDTFKFNASHFVAYRGFRERLHGHNYRASVRLIGSGGKIGGDGYVLDFGCVKEAVKYVCKGMNEYFIVPMLSDVLDIKVVEEEEGRDGEGRDGVEDDEEGMGDGEDDGEGMGTTTTTSRGGNGKRRRTRRDDHPPTTTSIGGGGAVTITCEDGSKFVFPRQDCLLLPIMHSTAEELAIYLYGKILGRLNANYLIERGVTIMEVTISEAMGQEATFRRSIPRGGTNSTGGVGIGVGGEIGEDPFDVASYVSRNRIPVMPCATDTEGARRWKTNPS
jgi:6-pyruvoyl-tetrahydropterin synthase